MEDPTAVRLGCTTALQAPTQVLLANGGHPTRAVLLMGVVTVLGSAMYGLLVLRRHLAHVGVSRTAVGIHVDLLGPMRADGLHHPRTRSAP